MNSIEDVFNKLRKYDTENDLTLSDDEQSIVLKIKDNKIVAFEGYVSVSLSSKGIVHDKYVTHWHPEDYKELYRDLLGLMKGRIEIPTKKQVNKGSIWAYLVAFMSLLIVNTLCELFNWKGFFLKSVLIIGSVTIFIFVIICIKIIIKFVKTKNIDKKDLYLIKRYVKMPTPHSDYIMDFYLTIDYISEVCDEFLKGNKKIHLSHPLEFTKEEIIKIKKIEKELKKDNDIEKEELYQLYLVTLDVIKIIYKYYDNNGVRIKHKSTS